MGSSLSLSSRPPPELPADVWFVVTTHLTPHALVAFSGVRRAWSWQSSDGAALLARAWRAQLVRDFRSPITGRPYAFVAAVEQRVAHNLARAWSNGISAQWHGIAVYASCWVHVGHVMRELVPQLCFAVTRPRPAAPATVHWDGGIWVQLGLSLSSPLRGHHVSVAESHSFPPDVRAWLTGLPRHRIDHPGLVQRRVGPWDEYADEATGAIVLVGWLRRQRRRPHQFLLWAIDVDYFTALKVGEGCTIRTHWSDMGTLGRSWPPPP